ANMDTTCAPCRDFDQYANGGWIARTTLPASYATYGAFTELSDRNQDVVHRLLEDAVKSLTAKPTGGSLEKLGLFYGSCMDSALAEREGMKPIEPELARIAAIHDVAGLSAEIARIHGEAVQGRNERAPALF